MKKLFSLLILTVSFFLSAFQALAAESISLPSTHTGNPSTFTDVYSSGAQPVTTDSASDTFRVTFTATSGNIQLTTTTGLSAVTGYPSSNWTSGTATEIAFTGSLTDVNNAAASLQFKGTEGVLTASVLNITSGGDASYYAETGSYYKFVNSSQTWNNARVAARGTTLNGIPGYLATVTSAAEFTFIKNKAGASQVWLGGTDSASEGVWRWIDDPGVPADESGVQFWQGSSTGYATNGMYTAWNGGEPNDSGSNEDALQIESSGNWNDLPTNSSVLPYVIEYTPSASDGSLATLNVQSATAPTLTSSNPSDGATSVGPSDNIVLTFSEAVSAGSGNVTIHKVSDDSVVATLSVTNTGFVSISSNIVTLNPSSDLSLSTDYYVLIDQTAFDAVDDGASFAGISSSTALNFTTASPQTSSPPSAVYLVDWNTANNSTYTSGATLNSRTVTVSTPVFGNSGDVFAGNWASMLGSGVAIDTNNDQGFSVATLTTGATTNISFSAPVTNPMVLFNWTDSSATTYDFSATTGTGSFVSVAANSGSGSATAVNNVVSTSGYANTSGDGFLVRLTGTFTSISFTATSGSNDTIGFSVGLDGYSVATTIGANGSATVSGNTLSASSTTTQVVEASGSETLTYAFSAVSHYALDTVNSSTTCGGTIGTSYTTSAITSDCAVSAVFTPSAVWADWTSIGSDTTASVGSPAAYNYVTSAAGTLKDATTGTTVNIAHSGEVISGTLCCGSTSLSGFTGWTDSGAYYPATSFDDASVVSPAAGNEDILMHAGYTQASAKTHTITFDSTVSGLVMGIWSLGGQGDATMVFSDDFEIVDTASGTASSGSGIIKGTDSSNGYTVTGGNSYGYNGLIQFYGDFGPSRPLTYTIIDPEFYFGMSIASTTRATTSASGGATVALDTSAPVLSSSSPADDATDVALGSNITLTFDEPVEDDGGSITLYDANDTIVQTFTGFTISGDGLTITLDPTNDLVVGQGYYINIASNAVKDALGNRYGGISDKTTLNFTAAVPFTSWATPSNVCTGAYNNAIYTGTETNYFGVNLNDDGELTSIYDHTFNSTTTGSTSFTSPFVLYQSQPAYRNSTPVAIGATQSLSASTGDFYLSGPDQTGTDVSDVIVYSFKIPGQAGDTVTVPYGDSTSHDQMLVAVQNASGAVLAQQYIAGDGVNVGSAANSGSLSFTMPSDGNAYLRYYVIDMGGGYGNVLDGGCAIYDGTAPTLTSSSPADDATDVAVGSNITLTFDEPIADNGGSITVYDANDTVVQTFTGFTISGDGLTVTLDPTNDLVAGMGHYIQIASNAITDAAGNAFAGISDKTTLNFTTALSTYTYIDMCGIVNDNPVIAAAYPVVTAGTGNSGTGIPFTTCAYTGSGGMGSLILAGANTAPAGAPSTIEIDVPDSTGLNTFYALLNNYYGTVGANEYTVAVNYTDGTSQSFNSIGGTDTRDFHQNVNTSNTVGANTTTWWSNYTAGANSYQRLDVRQFDISAGSAKTVKSVTLTQVHPTDSAMLSGLTFTTNTMGTLADADPVTTPQIDWVDWTMPGSYPKTGDRDTYATGTTGTVSNPANSATVNVTLTGEVMSKSADTFSSWNNSESSNGEGYNVDSNLYSPAGEDLIAQTGFTDAVDRAHTITFDQNVTGVVMGIWSLGGGQPSTLVFSDDFEVFDTESTGGMVRVDTALGYELRGGTGGADGSAGLIQFCGTFGPSNPLTYTVTDPEYYSGMNVAITTRTYTGGTCGATKEVDVTAPVITGPSGEPGDATSSIEVLAEQTAVTQFTADETVTWSITGGANSADFDLASDGTITFKTAPSFDAVTASNNVYVVEVQAKDEIGNISKQTLTVNVLPSAYPNEPGSSEEDEDGDGAKDSDESTTEDRDGDGIVDSQDYDPQGYFYCQADGRILSGGKVSVSGPGNVTMVHDGSETGEFAGNYQWFVDAPGTYTMTIDTSGMEFGTIAKASSGTMTIADFSGNPVVIGSTENGNTGYLGDYNGTPYDPANPTDYYTTFVIAAGDPNVFANNIPFQDCAIPEDIVEQTVDVLNNDMRKAVDAQQATIAGTSKSALQRLRSGYEQADFCGAQDDADIKANGRATAADVNLSGMFEATSYDCVKDRWVTQQGSMQVSKVDGFGMQYALSYSQKSEGFVSDSEVFGRFFGAYATQSNVTGTATGQIQGFGANAGFYGAKAFDQDVYLDYYVGGAVGSHGFTLAFPLIDDAVDVDGRYSYGAIMSGFALSAETQDTEAGEVSLLPRVGVDAVYAQPLSGDMTATLKSLTESSTLSLDTYRRLRGYAELQIETLSAESVEGGYSLGYALTPRVICDLVSPATQATCGYGATLTISQSDPANGTHMDVTLRGEKVGSTTTVGLDASRRKEVLNGAGVVTSTMGANQDGSFNVGQTLELKF